MSRVRSRTILLEIELEIDTLDEIAEQTWRRNGEVGFVRPETMITDAQVIAKAREDGHSVSDNARVSVEGDDNSKLIVLIKSAERAAT